MKNTNFKYSELLFSNYLLVFPNSKGEQNAIKLLKTLFHQNIIGNKHTPEHNVIKSKTKWLNKQERKEFQKYYKQLLKKEIILRIKKQTGKGTDWHISLNPRKLREIMEAMQ